MRAVLLKRAYRQYRLFGLSERTFKVRVAHPKYGDGHIEIATSIQIKNFVVPARRECALCPSILRVGSQDTVGLLQEESQPRAPVLSFLLNPGCLFSEP